MSALFRRRNQPSPGSVPSSPTPPSRSSQKPSGSTPTANKSNGSNGHGKPYTPPASSQSNHPRRRSFASLMSPRPPQPPELPNPLLTADYVVPSHIEAFREALATDLGQQEYNPTSSNNITGSSSWQVFGYGIKSPDPSVANDPKSPTPTSAASHPSMTEPSSTSASNPRKVGRIAAASDFAPIREKVTRKSSSKSKVDSGTREGFVYHTLRWPLLIAIFIVISLEFLAYVAVRQIVNVIEFSVAWRGRKGQLRKRMRSATQYEDWKEAALSQDEFLGYEKWKTQDGSGFYDWILVKKVKASLKAFREKDDVENLLGVLDLCLRNNFAGTENFRLYSETYFGTKYLVESYLAEVESSLQHVMHSDKVALEVKRSFYRTVNKNLGRSALCLSGGGSFGYYHIGVVRALLDANLLPKVVTGTSAGGLIAALTCTRTDDELREMLVPALADRITACEEPFSVWARRAWTTGARFDTVKWAEKASFFTMGSMTFKEAFERTGKVLCISVIPADRHSPVKLLNHITAPNCVIWSSLLASAAVPGILNPVCLMQKHRGSGNIVPWNWGHRFKDGSLRVDIPLQELHAMFNVNYPIVSQVNPHVHLFHFGSKGSPGRPTAHRKGKGWRGGFILSASERILKLHLSMNFKILRDLDLLPAILGQDWSSVFLQRFGGAVTILPKTRAWDWVRILSDPDRKELSRMMAVGKSVTFPKIHMIENRVRLEKAIEQGRKACRRAAAKARDKTNGNSQARSAVSSTANTPGSGASGGGGAKLAMSHLEDEADARKLEETGSGGSGGEGGKAATGRSFPPAPRSATSIASDTDIDDFFSSKPLPKSLSKVVGAAVHGRRTGGLQMDDLAGSNVGTPDSLLLEGGQPTPMTHDDHQGPNSSARDSDKGLKRPKPYPSFSYLIQQEYRPDNLGGSNFSSTVPTPARMNSDGEGEEEEDAYKTDEGSERQVGQDRLSSMEGEGTGPDRGPVDGAQPFLSAADVDRALRQDRKQARTSYSSQDSEVAVEGEDEDDAEGFPASRGTRSRSAPANVSGSGSASGSASRMYRIWKQAQQKQEEGRGQDRVTVNGASFRKRQRMGSWDDRSQDFGDLEDDDHENDDGEDEGLQPHQDRTPSTTTTTTNLFESTSEESDA